jgi:hypothetical protein
VTVSAPTDPPDDAFWRRPAPGEVTGPPVGPPTPAEPPPYAGPPQAPPPQATWQPPVVSQPPPPRSLPAQDPAALNDAEGSARTVTYGVGMVAAAVLVILMCLLCSRLIF